MADKLKTLFLLALCAVALTGCEQPTQEQIDADISAHINGFTYKGHRYILYQSDGMDTRIGGITHDPDCPCREEGGEDV